MEDVKLILISAWFLMVSYLSTCMSRNWRPMITMESFSILHLLLAAVQDVPWREPNDTVRGTALHVPCSNSEFVWPCPFRACCSAERPAPTARHPLRASEANYGGRVTDAHDRITITNLVTDYYCEDILKDVEKLDCTIQNIKMLKSLANELFCLVPLFSLYMCMYIMYHNGGICNLCFTSSCICRTVWQLHHCRMATSFQSRSLSPERFGVSPVSPVSPTVSAIEPSPRITLW